MKKSVLHELLAVEGDLDGAHKKILDETRTTFTKKADHFYGQHRKLEMFVDDGISYPEEFKAIDTTVQKKLDHMKVTEVRYFDAMLQKETTNQMASADLVVDGVVLAAGLPATFLLGMETRIKHLRTVYEAIPTLQPGIVWEKDESQGAGVYRTKNPAEKLKTETVIEPVVLYEATKEHPAQVKEVSKVNTVGKYTTTSWSSMITPAEKSALLSKIDKLIRAFKQARQRANTTAVIKTSVGESIFAFIDSK
ncbi:MAG: hypothetical protein KAH06_05370 [Desulfobacterales bacterium]|nr:hypothetical protein [Desulfobacterales bacterium]